MPAPSFSRTLVIFAAAALPLLAACHRQASSTDEHIAHMSTGDVAAPAGSAGRNPTSDALLRHSDIFCITAPSTPELRGFLDARRIALLPKDAVVVNVARGDMVDDEALISALKSRRLFAAGLDVYRGEPNLDPRYRTLPNTFLVPHIGSATVDTRNAMGFLLLDGLKAIEEGRRPSNQVI